MDIQQDLCGFFFQECMKFALCVTFMPYLPLQFFSIWPVKILLPSACWLTQHATAAWQ